LGNCPASAFSDVGLVVATRSGCGAAGAAALKLEANKIAEAESKASERVIWSAEARDELFLGVFMCLFLAFRLCA